MFERIRRAMVESFVGAVALGWLFAQGILHLVDIFAAPITGWIARSEYSTLTDHVSTGFLFRDSLPELARSFFLLLFWYILLRWLYFKPVRKETPESTSIPNPPS
jgi:hypothetical protein